MKNTTELKACPFCGGGWFRNPFKPEKTICLKCGAEAPSKVWNTRTAPELPEGYRVEELFCIGPASLYRGGRVVARRYENGELGIPARTLGAKDAEALAIFLQRRER